MTKRRKIENLAYSFIKQQIINQIWLEGMQIKELVVAEELGISRTPIRKALERLEKENLVYFKPNKGVYVNKRPLGLKEQKDRIYFLEVLLQHVLYSLEQGETKVSEKPIEDYLKAMQAFHSDRNDTFEKSEIEFWKTVLTYHENDYMNQTIIQTLNSLFESSVSATVLLDKSRPIKLTHYANLVDYIGNGNYTYARREVRILLNQLLINLIQGVD